uniref:Mitochondrial intermediate peptidase n=1 Tax=Lygus hesperus TaxID=30085 RepID=A0A0A9XLN3_LYGHE
MQLRRDMESNGIHLPDKQRQKVVDLNIENELLGMRLLEARQTANPYSTLTHLLRCRYELAQLLGFESFAQKQLQGKMLCTQEQVWHFLCSILHKYRTAA